MQCSKSKDFIVNLHFKHRNKTMVKHLPIYLLLLFLASAAVSCNSTSDVEETVASSNVAVKTFKLTADDSVLSNLDSVFFTIDLVNRQIYNADSLPKGTDVTKIIPIITFPLVSSATLHVTGGKVMKDSTINYSTNPSDSVDFTGNVTLTLVSEDKAETAVYTLKLNVHNMKPDSLYWNRLSRRDLPSFSTPTEQKTVKRGSNIYCMLKEEGKYIMSTTNNPSVGSNWNKQIINLAFSPNISSLMATDDALYILSDAGKLYTSSNGLNWSDCSTTFYSLIGGYQNTLLGIVKQNNTYYHSTYPASTLTEVDPEFPIVGASQPIMYSTEWSTSPQMLIMGGTTQNGSLVGSCWGYDGSQWGKITNKGIPGTTGCVFVPYFTYEVSTTWVATKYTTLLAIGGKTANGVSNKVYISRDMGVTWKLGDDLLQLPEYIPAFQNAQAIVLPTEYTRSNGNDDWEAYTSKKLPVWNRVIPAALSRSGYTISWECPYIYLFGGTNDSGVLYNNMWKGVLNRLSFKPLI